MRVGYMIASPENNEMLQRFGLGNYAMNQAGVAAAVASYNDATFINNSKQKIVEAREMILDAVAKNGLTAAPSETSFVFVDLGDLNAESFRQKMAEQNVLIRGIYQDYTRGSSSSAGGDSTGGAITSAKGNGLLAMKRLLVNHPEVFEKMVLGHMKELNRGTAETVAATGDPDCRFFFEHRSLVNITRRPPTGPGS